jgi:uncharacterized membrane protein YphA (DoxX/SURF4 family)
MAILRVSAATVITSISRMARGGWHLKDVEDVLEKVDARVAGWLASHGLMLLRISLGIVFLWFGALKFLPGVSPAQELATRTIGVLTFGHMPPSVALRVLATWECLIGVGLILGLFMRATLLVMLVQMMGTVTPLIFFPNETFTTFPYGLTLEGQYIIKNLVLISAGLVLGATVRGGTMVAELAEARHHS